MDLTGYAKILTAAKLYASRCEAAVLAEGGHATDQAWVKAQDAKQFALWNLEETVKAALDGDR